MVIMYLGPLRKLAAWTLIMFSGVCTAAARTPTGPQVVWFLRFWFLAVSAITAHQLQGRG